VRQERLSSSSQSRDTDVLPFRKPGGQESKMGSFWRRPNLKFDVLITVDTNIRYQQNMEGRSIVIVVLHSSSNRLEHLRQHFPACAVWPSRKSSRVKSFELAVLFSTPPHAGEHVS
jgi:hypothetical protein